jgi:hypothetical protein
MDFYDGNQPRSRMSSKRLCARAKYATRAAMSGVDREAGGLFVLCYYSERR